MLLAFMEVHVMISTHEQSIQIETSTDRTKGPFQGRPGAQGCSPVWPPTSNPCPAWPRFAASPSVGSDGLLVLQRLSSLEEKENSCGLSSGAGTAPFFAST